MRFLLVILHILLIASLSAPCVFAADLLGEWVQVDHWGARSNAPGEHKLDHKQTFPTHEQATFSFTITEQSPDGRGFSGTWCSKKKCEDLIGVMKSDGSFLFVDEDSYFEGTKLGDTLELCVLEADQEFRVAACKLFQRK